MVWLCITKILNYGGFFCQRIGPHKFLSKPFAFFIYVTHRCLSCSSFDNEVLTRHVWLSLEERRSNTYRVLKRIKNVLREQNCADHEFTCTCEQTVSHHEKHFGDALPLESNKASGAAVEETLLGGVRTSSSQKWGAERGVKEGRNTTCKHYIACFYALPSHVQRKNFLLELQQRCRANTLIFFSPKVHSFSLFLLIVYSSFMWFDCTIVSYFILVKAMLQRMKETKINCQACEILWKQVWELGLHKRWQSR